MIRLDVFAVGDSELEVWAANKQLPAMEAALKRPVKIVAHHEEDTEEPARIRGKPGPVQSSKFKVQSSKFNVQRSVQG
jgi:hypothetical protein